MKKDSKGQIIIASATEEYDYVSLSKVNKQLIGVNIENKVDEKIEDDEYSLDITKVDAETGEPIEAMAIFKVTLPDENHTSVYTETSETLLGPGKLDYCYIEQDKDYKIRLTHMKKPTTAGTYTYIFKEISAPEGYTKIDEDLILTIEFAEDPDTGKLYIKDAKSSNDNYLRINTETPITTDTKLSIDILNSLQGKNEYTVHYDANDNGEGTVVPNDQTKIENVNLTLDSNIQTRTGYTFKGWTTLPDSQIAQYKPGDNYSLDQDITLYAIWEKSEYTIHYDANDNEEGTAVPNDQTKEKGTDITLSDIEPEREGYIFKGWSTNKEATTGEYQPSDTFGVDADTTLYAIWEEKLYLKSTEYVITDENNYVEDAKLIENTYEDGDTHIMGILPKLTTESEDTATEWTKGTKLEDFKKNINTNADEIKLYDMNNNEITKQDRYLGTGMIIEFIKGNQNPIRITIVAKGDINGDGILNIGDVTKAKKNISEQIILLY